VAAAHLRELRKSGHVRPDDGEYDGGTCNNFDRDFGHPSASTAPVDVPYTILAGFLFSLAGLKRASRNWQATSLTYVAKLCQSDFLFSLWLRLELIVFISISSCLCTCLNDI
jgi:hypothetical protein